MEMPRRRFGGSGIDVSVLSLGSWMTFEEMSIADGVAVMRAAQDVGITFLDDARYDDRTGRAPIPTGYSEVRFGELFRAAGWQPRTTSSSRTSCGSKFWPRETLAAELDGSLQRMGFDHLDLEYCAPTARRPRGRGGRGCGRRAHRIGEAPRRGVSSTGPSASCKRP